MSIETEDVSAPQVVRTAVGADLGGTKMAVGVVNEQREVSHRNEVPTHGLDRDQLLERIYSTLAGAMEADPSTEAIGLGLPCAIDRERGTLINAVNLPLHDVPIRDLLSERLGVPVFLDNDANVAGLAEHRFGASKGATNAVMLTIGTGVGGGLIIDGQVYRGRGSAPELGHIVIDQDGPPCQGSCPNHGCIEALASGTAIGREGRAAAQSNPDSVIGKALAEGNDVDGRLVTDAALDGDATSIEVMALIGRRLGVAISSLANIFEPDIFVIGGGACRAGSLLINPARDELRARALPPQNMTDIVIAELGPEAGLIGAATMALEESVTA